MDITYIPELDTPRSGKKHILIDIDNLYLDKDNPRFAASKLIQSSDTAQSQNAIIQYLASYAKITDLANSIVKQQGLYEEEWIACYKNPEGYFIVLEGNRRIAACKLLLSKGNEFQDIKQNHLLLTLLDKNSIKKIKAVLYDDPEVAQNYIASKHTNPSVLEWSVPEQCHYFLSLFEKGRSPRDIAIQIGIEKTDLITRRIREYKQFLSVFNLLNDSSETPVYVEEINMLPISQKFLNILAGDSEVGLKLDYDKDKLEYSPKPHLSSLYNEILKIIGEAFFLRPVYGKKDTRERDKDNHYRISTDEIKSQKLTIPLIKKDIRIPGLWEKIQKYQQEAFGDHNSSAKPGGGSTDGNNSATAANTGNHSGSGNQDHSSSNNHSASGNTATGSSKAMPQPPYFFQGLDYSKLDPNDRDDQGLLYLCREIDGFSKKTNRMIDKYPICATFLVRAIIEQSLIYYSKKHKRNDNHKFICNDIMSNGSFGGFEKLSNIIKTYKKNLTNYIASSEIREYFTHLFGKYIPNELEQIYVLDSLNWVVHRPADYHLQPQDILSLTERGLFRIIQYLIS